MSDFTPVSALVGGALIATSLALMLIATGRIAGLSGIFAGVLGEAPSRAGEIGWRVWFMVGMVAAGAGFARVRPETFDHDVAASIPQVIAAGVLVGVGTRLGSGCTSGHGLCGMSRGSRRSIVATCAFFAIGVATATIVGGLS